MFRSTEQQPVVQSRLTSGDLHAWRRLELP